jgi:hypothetical protein
MERFTDRVMFWPSGCWQWLGAIGGHTKYGNYYDPDTGKKHVAHRWIYEKVRGLIPEGMQAHHTCGSSTCVNPYHIKLLTPKQHQATKRNHNRELTHCKRGHKLAGDNVWIRRGRGGAERVCRACKSLRDHGTGIEGEGRWEVE